MLERKGGPIGMALVNGAAIIATEKPEPPSRLGGDPAHRGSEHSCRRDTGRYVRALIEFVCLFG